MTTRFRLRRADGKTFLHRRGFECDRFGIYLHKMEAEDPGVDLHDHPWPFGSLILWGGYWEERCNVDKAIRRAQVAEFVETFGPYHCPRGDMVKRGWFSWRRLGLHECHRITGLFWKTNWSLVIRGRKRTDRQWGFFTPTGFVDSDEYDKDRRDMWEEAA